MGGDWYRKAIETVQRSLLIEWNFHNFSTCSHISFFGQINGALARNSIGIRVFGDGENLKFSKSLMRPIFVCIKPNRSPTQLRGPSPVELQIWLSTTNLKWFRLYRMGGEPWGDAVACSLRWIFRGQTFLDLGRHRDRSECHKQAQRAKCLSRLTDSSREFCSHWKWVGLDCRLVAIFSRFLWEVWRWIAGKMKWLQALTVDNHLQVIHLQHGFISQFVFVFRQNISDVLSQFLLEIGIQWKLVKREHHRRAAGFKARNEEQDCGTE
jgi:hypothetical protein